MIILLTVTVLLLLDLSKDAVDLVLEQLLKPFLSLIVKVVAVTEFAGKFFRSVPLEYNDALRLRGGVETPEVHIYE